ncbi:MAG: hypothetical protein J0I41_18690 [Filimonas sp.]|nr:hypothetical protein [Filimonas sp.]
MKPIPIFLFANMTLLAACGTGSNSPQKETAIESKVAYPDDVKGTYKGDFAGSPIFITLNYYSGKNVAGYNVHKGLRRNIHGVLEPSGNNWVLTLAEPGDNPYDGNFKLVFSKDFKTAEGKWVPVNTATLKEKQFTLAVVERQESTETGDFGSYDNMLSGDHCDIAFNQDGSCIYNYYDKITDSTFVNQMNTVRGTWERKGDKIFVAWQSNAQFQKKNSEFELVYEKGDETNSRYLRNVKGEGREFWYGP